MDPTVEIPSKPIAIHERSGSFSDEWIAHCEEKNIPYVLVDCYRTDIVKVVSECSGLMWHWSHNDASAANFARQLTRSLEARGIPVFPNSQTSWHYDDKLGQKYLFEALEIPHATSHAFYRKADAVNFIENTSLPVVFKLSRGANSQNVVLVKNRKHATRLVRRSFGRGWRDRNRTHALSERIWHFRRDKNLESAVNILKGLGRLIFPHHAYRTKRIESAYVYFQDFVPGNDSDFRVTVIGEKAIGFKRMVRRGDFRASGSGSVILDPVAVPLEAVRIAFESAEKSGVQIAAFDFVLDGDNPLVVEMSYAFNPHLTKVLPGYWDRNLKWHNETLVTGAAMLEEFLIEIQRADASQRNY